MNRSKVELLAPKITNVTVESGFDLIVEFENGERGVLNMKPHLPFGKFRALQDGDLFTQVRVASGTLEWPGGITLDPEFVKENCQVKQQIPSEFSQAITYLWAGLFSGILSMTVGPLMINQRLTLMPEEIGAIIISLGIWSFLTLKVSRMRNWARITYLLLVLLSLPFGLLSVLSEFSIEWRVGMLSAASILLQLWGLWLLFLSPAKTLFQRETGQAK